MKRFRNASIISLFVIIAFAKCIPTTPGGGTVTPAATYREIIDTAYGTDPQQKMNIYLPAGRTTTDTKTIVLIHGGGWQTGNKDEATYTAIVNRIKVTWPEVAIVNMNYRLVTGASSTTHLPEIISDVTAAFNFLQANKTAFVISSKYGIWGLSAGAHIATLYAYAYDPNHNIKAVADWFGPTDFITPQPGDVNFLLVLFGQSKNIYTVEKELLGVERAANPQLWNDASPLNKVTSITPPTIMIHDDADLVVPYNHSYQLMTKLNASGVNNSFINISYFIENMPSNLFHFNPSFHDFTDPGNCGTVDCGIFDMNVIRNYSVDTTLHYMKRFM